MVPHAHSARGALELATIAHLFFLGTTLSILPRPHVESEHETFASCAICDEPTCFPTEGGSKQLQGRPKTGGLRIASDLQPASKRASWRKCHGRGAPGA